MEEIGLQTVRWDSDMISEVTPSTSAAEPELSVIPGLIDTHVHITGPAQPSNYTYGTWPLINSGAEQALHSAAHAQRDARGQVGKRIGPGG